MRRAIWAGLVVCAVGAGCTGPQYYPAPPEQVPPPANVGGASVQIVDQRPEWEKKPFTGNVCLYHLSKAHPDAWTQLANETAAVVNAMPQKPERVEVVVTSFRLVRAADIQKPYRDLSAGPNVNPQLARTPQALSRTLPSDEARDREVSRNALTRPAQGSTSGDTGSTVGTSMFTSSDDPRRMLREHPAGASCSLQAKIKFVFPGGREQSVDVNVLARGANESGTQYWGDAMDFAARSAMQQYGRQVRSGVGLNPDQ